MKALAGKIVGLLHHSRRRQYINSSFDAALKKKIDSVPGSRTGHHGAAFEFLHFTGDVAQRIHRMHRGGPDEFALRPRVPRHRAVDITN